MFISSPLSIIITSSSETGNIYTNYTGKKYHSPILAYVV